MSRRFFVGGNFKMNGTSDGIKKIASNLASANLDPKTGYLPRSEQPANVRYGVTEIVVAPPSLYLSLARDCFPSNIEIAAQNVFDKSVGAFTGEIAVSQLVDLGIKWTLLGHSERRMILNEDDQFIASKTKAALDGGLRVILCCGESLEQREQDKTIEVVTSQLNVVKEKVNDWTNIVIAYEPIWAIGTGKVASAEQAQAVHKAIRDWLRKEVTEKASTETRIIYGGSVSETNCKNLSVQPDIDGFLVGGASLKPSFVDIINSNL
ncbi:Triosephosphate isomerase [Golovinomyces cichoracearum]|uniref:Triosephosphate isomerase n=1 Tax=Golovinomyces cichoracearum TaxID=62708 RepID=A0A420HMS1_9PEZI|nr:Triosephosphate isomerase [Golovinomyces cichoracearum]